jgi:hypothetical protein
MRYVPEQIEKYASSKRFLKAATLLIETASTLSGPSFREVSFVSGSLAVCGMGGVLE